MARAHLMVRENEVGAPSLHRKRGGEVLLGDDSALDVPARPSVTELSPGPAGLTLPGHSPQKRVQRLPLASTITTAETRKASCEARVTVKSSASDMAARQKKVKSEKVEM